MKEAVGSGPRVAFGDLELDWGGQRLRRGREAGWRLIGEETADVLEALIQADGHKLWCETLWKAVAGRGLAFCGVALTRMIRDANRHLTELDCEILVESFAVRLADVTPRPFLPARSDA
jgi:hypothetical protein